MRTPFVPCSIKVISRLLGATMVALLCDLPFALGANEVDALYAPQKTWVETMIALRSAVAQRRQAGEPMDDATWDGLCRRLWEDFTEMDWFMQDAPTRPSRDSVFQPSRDFAWSFDPQSAAVNQRALINKVLDELGDGAAALRERLDRLVAVNTPADDARWLDLYVEACRRRRQLRLESLAKQTPQFVFTKHYTLGGSHYAYTEGQSDAQHERHFKPPAALCLARWDGTQYSVETLVDDPQGVIRDPDISFDGKRVLFAWKKSSRHDDYHLYEMELASRTVRQLTEGLGVADYEGAYLPDGDIIFNSTRCVQIVDCWWTEVSNLYRCDPSGKRIRRLTFDQVHTNFPTVTEDGRMLYTRWEYNDRGQIYTQPLLQMNPDGTGQAEFYGGNSWFPTTILHARSVPGTRKVVAIATGHHSRQTGKLILIDPARGRQENQGVQLIAPPRPTPAVKIDAYGQDGELFQYPYPISETEYLVTYHPVGWRWAGEYGPRFAIYFATIDGRRELLVRDQRLPCNQSIPVRARQAHVRPSTVDFRRSDGVCYVQDVYAGSGLNGVERGTVKRLRVVSLAFRAAGIGENYNGGPGGGAVVSTPIAVGNGAWDPKTIIGDSEVHPDGSAVFRVPARTPVYFQLLDEQGRMVQSMRSWVTLQPGETASCVGCHEHKNTAPLHERRLSEALREPPKELEQPFGPPRGFSFLREVQPILNAKCAQCHDGSAEKPLDLTDREILDPRAKRRWTAAYLTLTHARPDKPHDGWAWRGDPDHRLVNWISAQSVPNMLPPYSAGSARSKLIDMMIAGHEGVTLAQEEMAKLMAWIDLGVPFCGDYREAHAWSDEEVARYEHFLSKRRRLAELEAEHLDYWLSTSGE